MVKLGKTLLFGVVSSSARAVVQKEKGFLLQMICVPRAMILQLSTVVALSDAEKYLSPSMLGVYNLVTNLPSAADSQ